MLELYAYTGIATMVALALLYPVAASAEKHDGYFVRAIACGAIWPLAWLMVISAVMKGADDGD